MKLLPENPKMRQRVLIAALSLVLLVGFGFFWLTYFGPETPVSLEETGSPSEATVSEVQKLERDIANLKAELANEFYRDLSKTSWTPDRSNPGKANPFSP